MKAPDAVLGSKGTAILDQAPPILEREPERPFDLNDPACYFNRELSLLEFQRRVLEEACDPTNPLLDQVRFISIFGSNMDEFFMTRVAGLKQQVTLGVIEKPADGLSPQAQLEAIRERVQPMFEEVRQHLSSHLLPSLAEQGVRILDYDDLTEGQKTVVGEVFRKEVFPVLTPLAFDPGRPFPHISNLSLNLAVRVNSPRHGERFARLKVPNTLPRLIRAPVVGNTTPPQQFSFVWLEQVILANLPLLFPGVEVTEAYPFRVTRDADIEIQEDEASDLLQTIQASLRRRRFGRVVRLTIDARMPDHIRKLLVDNLELDPKSVFPVEGPLGLSDLMYLFSNVDRPDLKFPAFVPVVPPLLQEQEEPQSIFDIIRQQNVLLHHPYQSFEPVVDFLRTAARDPQVLAIKQTLYRVGKDSPIVQALMEARENDKEVAVLVELKARFDEESNITWARALERVGVHVVYGLMGLKTHAKVTLVVRREADGLRRYLHLGTGNYNATTARLYADLGLFACDEAFADDTAELFNQLTGYAQEAHYRELLVAPTNLRQMILALIEREIGRHSPNNPARLVFKMNHLVDTPMIRALYRASQAGVRIDLIVRATCCLRPGIVGLSDNIRVVSIVGRFLEHSRIFYFKNGGDEEIYLGSADLMPRNLNWRVETVYPVKDAAIRNQIRDKILLPNLQDNQQARLLLPDGTYTRLAPANGEAPFDYQIEMMRMVQQEAVFEGGPEAAVVAETGE